MEIAKTPINQQTCLFLESNQFSSSPFRGGEVFFPSTLCNLSAACNTSCGIILIISGSLGSTQKSSEIFLLSLASYNEKVRKNGSGWKISSYNCVNRFFLVLNLYTECGGFIPLKINSYFFLFLTWIYLRGNLMFCTTTISSIYNFNLNIYLTHRILKNM